MGRPLYIHGLGHFHQDGSAVQRFAIKTTRTCIEQLIPDARAHTAETGGAIRFIGHQANLLMLQAVARKLEIDEQHHWHNVEDYGNTAAAGAPTVLSQHWDELTDGDSVVLVVVGAGLTWSSLHLQVGNACATPSF